MEKARVYFTTMRTVGDENICEKLVRLCRTAGIEKIDFKDKFTAIKLHFGEAGNLAFLRPEYARAVADLIRSLGGKPFVTDCSTLYVGRRKNALDHLELAYQHGYNPFVTGCQTIIADGLKGNDEVEVPVEGGEYVKAAKIGRAVMDADVFISLTHFKGHEQAGMGGALKNIGMGCGSRAGKTEQHSNGKPSINEDVCRGCRRCQRECANGGLVFDNEKRKMHVDHDQCVGCGRCIAVCPKDAIHPTFQASVRLLNCKIAEYAKAVLDGRPSYCINIVRDVSPNCDCHPENDVPIVPDVGMFASADPVALDLACAEAINRQPVLPNSAITDLKHEHDCDRFHAAHDNTHWQDLIEHGKKLGIGQDTYELVTIR